MFPDAGRSTLLGDTESEAPPQHVPVCVACDSQRVSFKAKEQESWSARKSSTCRGDKELSGGSPVSRRGRTEMERLCGPELPFWVSTLPSQPVFDLVFLSCLPCMSQDTVTPLALCVLGVLATT